MSDETGGSHLQAPVQSSGSPWTPRVLLLGPALMQIVVAYLLSRELRSLSSQAGVLLPVILLALGGAGGLVAGVFGRSRRLFRLGLLCSLLGFAFPAAVEAASTPVTKDASTIPGLGEFDAEGLGTVMLLRMLVELPLWVLYGLISMVAYLGSRQTERRTAAPHIPSDPRPR